MENLPMSINTLFDETTLSTGLTLANRIVMAPLTRCMADDNLVPTDAMAAYYGKRADTGLIISEATIISPIAQGYPNTPGLFTQAQISGWRKVTEQVHKNGGKIFAQLWHTGRASHAIYHQGKDPVAPSAIGLTGRVSRTELDYGVPRALTHDEIEQTIVDYATAAANAKQAGFDGVELHGANGYLIDQFLHYSSNTRKDSWGGNPENMVRFLLRIIEAVKQEITHVGLRLSPAAYFNMEHDERDIAVFDLLLSLLNKQALSYVHTGMFDDSPIDYLNGTVTQYLRKHYQGIVIASGSYSANSGADMIIKGDADLLAIGRPLIANPDYVKRVRSSQPLTDYNEAMLTELV
jgi:2,4-dienoyl-CoA reductase-like NADH-dependent reductase (Old Yellow Enzyme family)